MNDITTWIDSAADEKTLILRQAIHTILFAIASSVDLQPTMIMKGGILLAIRYDTGRFTKDIDFSDVKQFKDFDETKFVTAFSGSLIEASSALFYQLECRLQTYQVQPNRDGSFPTMQMRVGYANKLDRSSFARLLKNQAPNVVQVDYSFNESIQDFDIIDVDHGTSVRAYGETTLVAEKIRSVLQQVVRNRSRRQDIFDLHFLLTHHPISDYKKPQILKVLIEKCRSRGVEATRHSMADPEIYKRSAQDYDTLADDVEGNLPDFDVAFSAVRIFYESLPW